MRNKFNSHLNYINQLMIYPIPDREILDNSLKYMSKDNPSSEIREKDLKRVMVNHIRHCNTTYDMVREKSKKFKPYSYKQASYRMVKNTTLQMIRDFYPYLGEECYRQSL